MKKLWVTLAFCTSILTIQASFAVERDHAVTPHSSTSDDRRSKEKNRHSSDGQRAEYPDKHRHSKRGWQAGTTLPEEYRQSDNQIDYSQHSRLSAPTQYQQWRKVNNQYVLMNVLTNTIIKVVPEHQKGDR